MKKKLLVLPLLLCSILLFSQQNDYALSEAFTKFDDDLQWVELAPENAISATSFFPQHFQYFSLDKPQDMQLAKKQHDALGWTHSRYTQFHKGIRVEGGTYILHEKNNRVVKANGRLYPNIQVNLVPFIDADQILDQALTTFPAQRYAWENPVTENILRRVKKNPQATHYPQPELVILDRSYPKSSGQYALAYKLIIYRESPMMDRRMLWYDAHSGELLLNVNMLHDTHGEEGVAQTRYHGEQLILTTKDSLGNYILRDTSRGGGIETYNANYSTNGNLAEFTDEDNFWDNVNEEQDEVATDVHFGTMATYDFYWEHFGRNSYDDQSSPMISRVHFGNRLNNAFWDGSVMSYGDGDNIRLNPLTAIDIVGHEITHGVTEFSAGLIYTGESGALNESFSDIFGKSIEAIYAPEGFSWIPGERMLIDKSDFSRSMENPPLGEDPKYYKGSRWVDGASVHTNSGVQNFWYYLLCEGQQGVNEAGYTYDVPAIGMEKAMRIAYHNLTSYLTENSGYLEARSGSLQAAADLYGICSDEYKAVAEAWTAVGVGAPIVANDYGIYFSAIQPSACTIDEVEVMVNILNNSCATTLTANTKITLHYQLDNETPVNEQLDLNNDLPPGASISYSFIQKITNPPIGLHTLKAWINFANDPYSPNNLAQYTFENQPYQNAEFTAESAQANSSVCNQIDFRTFFGLFKYAGCDSLPKDTRIPYRIVFKDQIIENQERLSSSLSPDGFISIGDVINFNTYGFGESYIETLYPDDPTNENNFAYVFLGRIAETGIGWNEQFDQGLMDSTTLAIRPASYSHNAIQAVDDSYQLVMTGGDILDENNKLLVNPYANPSLFFSSNSMFHTTLHLCVDFKGLSKPTLVFDLKQTNSNVDWSVYEIDPDFATMLKVEINGRTDTILFGANMTDPQTYRLDVSRFAGGSYEIKLTALALQASIDPITKEINLDGDNVIIDNIRLELGGFNETPKELIKQDLELSPNPSINNFTLRRKDFRAIKPLEIKVIDVSGKMLLNEQLTKPVSTYSFGNNFSAGVYFLHLIDGNESIHFKLIKQ